MNTIRAFFGGKHDTFFNFQKKSRGDPEAADQRCSIKKVFLEILQNSQQFTELCQSLFFNKVASGNFIKKETLARVFPFCDISV